MWQKASSFILRYRVLILICVIIFTIFMGYTGRNIEMTYTYAQMLPGKDSAAIDYRKFNETFGEEGNIIIIAVEDEDFFELKHFNRWQKLCNELGQVGAVEDMLSVSNAIQLVRNNEERKFDVEPIFNDDIHSQKELDSLRQILNNIPLYNEYLYNDEINAYLIVLTMNKDRMATKEREELVQQIRELSKEYEADTGNEIRYSGMPYINVRNSMLIKSEIFLFTGLALVICLIILLLFFKSFKAMFFPALVVLAGVATSLGSMVLLGYQITILTGFIPPLLIVIGIPNSIYILNKYHHEYRIHKNQIKALKRVIMKIGNSILLTNFTTALGFAAFITTNSDILIEFGIIASINIIFLFFLSISLIPIFFSFLAPPGERHVKHLKRRTLGSIIEVLVAISQKYRKAVYVSMVVVLAASFYGISLMKTTGYMLDDIPENDPINVDLRFFEQNFGGVLPLEIIIDTKKPNGIMQQSVLQKIDLLDQKLSTYEELSSSLSLINVIKLAKQAFFNGLPQYYSLPSNSERNFILPYVNNADADIGMAKSFVDSTMQKARISLRVKDIGTKRMDSLYNKIEADVAEIFPHDEFELTITGSMVTFFRGNQYLVRNLFISLALAIAVISFFMALMFRSRRMVLMFLIPNIIPLLATAGIMGFFDIPIKTSTILVFSVAFGISVDNTIHFLAKYRQELNLTCWNIKQSVINALRETGISMMYTSTVLFFGFGIFSLSSFGGTQAMGILVSITLLIALISNLIVLPSLLIGLEKIITTKSFHDPIINLNEVQEEEEEEEEQKPIQ